MATDIEFKSLFANETPKKNILIQEFNELLASARGKNHFNMDELNNSVLASSLELAQKNTLDMIDTLGGTDTLVIDNYKIDSASNIKVAKKQYTKTWSGGSKQVDGYEITITDSDKKKHVYNVANLENIKYLNPDEEVKTVSIASLLNTSKGVYKNDIKPEFIKGEPKTYIGTDGAKDTLVLKGSRGDYVFSNSNDGGIKITDWRTNAYITVHGFDQVTFENPLNKNEKSYGLTLNGYLTGDQTEPSLPLINVGDTEGSESAQTTKNDYYRGSQKNDLLKGGKGDDLFVESLVRSGQPTDVVMFDDIYGGEGNDTFTANLSREDYRITNTDFYGKKLDYTLVVNLKTGAATKLRNVEKIVFAKETNAEKKTLDLTGKWTPDTPVQISPGLSYLGTMEGKYGEFISIVNHEDVTYFDGQGGLDIIDFGTGVDIKDITFEVTKDKLIKVTLAGNKDRKERIFTLKDIEGLNISDKKAIPTYFDLRGIDLNKPGIQTQNVKKTELTKLLTYEGTSGNDTFLGIRFGGQQQTFKWSAGVDLIDGFRYDKNQFNNSSVAEDNHIFVIEDANAKIGTGKNEFTITQSGKPGDYVYTITQNGTKNVTTLKHIAKLKVGNVTYDLTQKFDASNKPVVITETSNSGTPKDDIIEWDGKTKKIDGGTGNDTVVFDKSLKLSDFEFEKVSEDGFFNPKKWILTVNGKTLSLNNIEKIKIGDDYYDLTPKTENFPFDPFKIKSGTDKNDDFEWKGDESIIYDGKNGSDTLKLDKNLHMNNLTFVKKDGYIFIDNHYTSNTIVLKNTEKLVVQGITYDLTKEFSFEKPPELNKPTQISTKPSKGNDRITWDGKAKEIRASLGIDTVVFDKKITNYSFEKNKVGFIIVTDRTTKQSVTLIDAEIAEFAGKKHVLATWLTKEENAVDGTLAPVEYEKESDAIPAYVNTSEFDEESEAEDPTSFSIEGSDMPDEFFHTYKKGFEKYEYDGLNGTDTFFLQGKISDYTFSSGKDTDQDPYILIKKKGEPDIRIYNMERLVIGEDAYDLTKEFVNGKPQALT